MLNLRGGGCSGIWHVARPSSLRKILQVRKNFSSIYAMLHFWYSIIEWFEGSTFTFTRHTQLINEWHRNWQQTVTTHNKFSWNFRNRRCPQVRSTRQGAFLNLKLFNRVNCGGANLPSSLPGAKVMPFLRHFFLSHSPRPLILGLSPGSSWPEVCEIRKKLLGLKPTCLKHWFKSGRSSKVAKYIRGTELRDLVVAISP